MIDTLINGIYFLNGKNNRIKNEKKKKGFLKIIVVDGKINFI